MKLSEAIKLIQDIDLSNLTAEQKEAVSSTRDVFKITTDPDELQAAGFDGDIMALAKTLLVSKPKPSSPKAKEKPKSEPKYKVGSVVRVIGGEEMGQVGIIEKAYEGTHVLNDGTITSPYYEVTNTGKMIPEGNLKLISKPTEKSRAKAAKAFKARSSVKKAKASRKNNAKPRPKLEQSTTTKKEEAVPKVAKTTKPAVEKPQKSVKATPKKEKGPTASEKAKEKALVEIKLLDKDIAAYRKRINDNSDIINRLAASLVSQGKSVSATLGALPDKVREELLLKRRQKAILQRIVKRDASYFENAAKTLKKANALPEGLEKDLKSVSMTLTQLKDRTVQQRKQTTKKNKSFLSKILP